MFSHPDYERLVDIVVKIIYRLEIDNHKIMVKVKVVLLDKVWEHVRQVGKLDLNKFLTNLVLIMLISAVY